MIKTIATIPSWNAAIKRGAISFFFKLMIILAFDATLFIPLNIRLQSGIKHVTQILKAYPGGMIDISHDADLLRKININRFLGI